MGEEATTCKKNRSIPGSASNKRQGKTPAAGVGPRATIRKGVSTVGGRSRLHRGRRPRRVANGKGRWTSSSAIVTVSSSKTSTLHSLGRGEAREDGPPPTTRSVRTGRRGANERGQGRGRSATTMEAAPTRRRGRSTSRVREADAETTPHSLAISSSPESSSTGAKRRKTRPHTPARTGRKDATGSRDRRRCRTGGDNGISFPIVSASHMITKFHGSDQMDADWIQRLLELKHYHAEHGDCRCPINSPLGAWVANQRNQYVRWRSGKRSSMRLERITMLECISGVSGWSWIPPTEKTSATEAGGMMTTTAIVATAADADVAASTNPSESTSEGEAMNASFDGRSMTMDGATTAAVTGRVVAASEVEVGAAVVALPTTTTTAVGTSTTTTDTTADVVPSSPRSAADDGATTRDEAKTVTGRADEESATADLAADEEVDDPPPPPPGPPYPALVTVPPPAPAYATSSAAKEGAVGPGRLSNAAGTPGTGASVEKESAPTGQPSRRGDTKGDEGVDPGADYVAGGDDAMEAIVPPTIMMTETETEARCGAPDGMGQAGRVTAPPEAAESEPAHPALSASSSASTASSSSPPATTAPSPAAPTDTQARPGEATKKEVRMATTEESTEVSDKGSEQSESKKRSPSVTTATAPTASQSGSTGEMNTGRWTAEEHELFLQELDRWGWGSWKEIATSIKSRTGAQVRTHAKKYSLKKVPEATQNGRVPSVGWSRFWASALAADAVTEPPPDKVASGSGARVGTSAAGGAPQSAGLAPATTKGADSGNGRSGGPGKDTPTTALGEWDDEAVLDLIPDGNTSPSPGGGGSGASTNHHFTFSEYSSMIGQRVAKRFADLKVYEGYVARIDKIEGGGIEFLIEYMDGDSQHVEWEELQDMRELFRSRDDDKCCNAPSSAHRSREANNVVDEGKTKKNPDTSLSTMMPPRREDDNEIVVRKIRAAALSSTNSHGGVEFEAEEKKRRLEQESQQDYERVLNEHRNEKAGRSDSRATRMWAERNEQAKSGHETLDGTECNILGKAGQQARGREGKERSVSAKMENEGVVRRKDESKQSAVVEATKGDEGGDPGPDYGAGGDDATEAIVPPTIMMTETESGAPDGVGQAGRVTTPSEATESEPTHPASSASSSASTALSSSPPAKTAPSPAALTDTQARPGEATKKEVRPATTEESIEASDEGSQQSKSKKRSPSVTTATAPTASQSGSRGEMNTGRWTAEEHELFLQELDWRGWGSWKEIATSIKSRTGAQVRTHAKKYFSKKVPEARQNGRVPAVGWSGFAVSTASSTSAPASTSTLASGWEPMESTISPVVEAMTVAVAAYREVVVEGCSGEAGAVTMMGDESDGALGAIVADLPPPIAAKGRTRSMQAAANGASAGRGPSVALGAKMVGRAERGEAPLPPRLPPSRRAPGETDAIGGPQLATGTTSIAIPGESAECPTMEKAAENSALAALLQLPLSPTRAPVDGERGEEDAFPSSAAARVRHSGDMNRGVAAEDEGESVRTRAVHTRAAPGVNLAAAVLVGLGSTDRGVTAALAATDPLVAENLLVAENARLPTAAVVEEETRDLDPVVGGGKHTEGSYGADCPTATVADAKLPKGGILPVNVDDDVDVYEEGTPYRAKVLRSRSDKVEGSGDSYLVHFVGFGKKSERWVHASDVVKVFTNLEAGQRVYAAWLEDEDEDEDDNWFPGTVVGSKEVRSGRKNDRGKISYHIRFDDLDEDNDLADRFVVPFEHYHP